MFCVAKYFKDLYRKLKEQEKKVKGGGEKGVMIDATVVESTTKTYIEGYRFYMIQSLFFFLFLVADSSFTFILFVAKCVMNDGSHSKKVKMDKSTGFHAPFLNVILECVGY